MPKMRPEVLRGLSLAAGTLLMIHGGASLIFSVYTNAVKTKYLYTQSEMAVITGFATFGAYLALPGGILTEKLGPRCISLVNGILCLGGYLLLWSATLMTPFYRGHSWLLCLYFFLATYTGVSSYIISLSCNVYNFHPKYRGTIIGYLESVFSLGTSVFVVVYSTCFINGYVIDEGKQDIGDFFLMLAVSGAVVNVLCAMFLGQYPTNTDYMYDQLDGTDSSCLKEDFEQPAPAVHGEGKQESSLSEGMYGSGYGAETQRSDLAVGTLKSDHGQLTEKSGPDAGPKESDISASGDQSELGLDGPEHIVDITGIALLKTLDFQLLFWCALFSSWVVNMLLMNINVYLKSFNFEMYSISFNVLLPVIATISKVSAGLLSDLILYAVPRAVVFQLIHEVDQSDKLVEVV
ncbi:uncharacterized protein LOC135500783 [Lineus longissimus]|uniref:uncharacterized protein LOC135500783 n=1 Tax=Lineus longissimus TaxID=88925 RepID=UPI00315DB4CC